MAISMRHLFEKRGLPGMGVSLRHSLENHPDGLGIGLREAHQRFLKLHIGNGFNRGCRSPDAITASILGFLKHNLGQILPAWVAVDADDEGREVRVCEGVLLQAKVTHEDFPLKPWHTFYDWNFHVQLDDQYSYLLNEETSEHHSESLLEKNSKPEMIIENEWDSAFVQLWAVPMKGDRVWMMGRWIYDCGHPPEVTVRLTVPHPPGEPLLVSKTVYTRSQFQEAKDQGGVVIKGNPDRLGTHRMELHPLRALVSFRSEGALLRGNSRPTRANQAVVYIGRQGGYIRQQINDRDYAFDLPLPPKPHPDATPATAVVLIPDTLTAQPELTPFPPNDPKLMRVRIPLEGTPGLQEYGAILSAGWRDVDGSEAKKVTRYRVTIEKVIRQDPPLIVNGQPLVRQIFFFVGVNGRWLRRDFETNEMRLDFPTELALHDEDTIKISACGFVRTNIFRFMGEATGVADALVSRTSDIEDAKNAAARVVDAFTSIPIPISKGNDPIRLFFKEHSPVVPDRYTENSRDNPPRKDDGGETRHYILEYTIARL